MHKKPSAFRLDDLLSFGGLAVLIAALSTFVTVMASLGKVEIGNGANPWTAVLLCWVVTAAFLGIYLRLLFLRDKELRKFLWVAEPSGQYAFMINAGDYPLNDSDLHEEILCTINRWGTTYGWVETYGDPWKTFRENIVWVWFKPWPVESLSGTKVAGFTISRTHQMVVGYYEGQVLSETAFAHELGHIIQGHQTGDWNQEAHHNRSKELGLP